MNKNFDGWNNNKKRIHEEKSNVFYHEREVWWCSLGVNIGNEQDGSGDEYRRPVLILKGLSKEICLVIPPTSSANEHKLRPSIGIIDGKKANALISQIRVIDKKRLVRKIGYVHPDIFNQMRKIVKNLL
jgi:mRNA-degrading endonuclease toxin of MazEF toxin-antitoxin module